MPWLENYFSIFIPEHFGSLYCGTGDSFEIFEILFKAVNDFSFSEPIIEIHDRDFGCCFRSVMALKFWNLVFVGIEGRHGHVLILGP